MNPNFWRLVLQRCLASVGAIALLVGFHFVFLISILGPFGLVLWPIATAVCPAAVADADPAQCFTALAKILDLFVFVLTSMFLLRYVDRRNGRTSQYGVILLQTTLTILIVALVVAYQDYRKQDGMNQAVQREIASLGDREPERVSFLARTHVEAPNFWDSFVRVFTVYRQ